MSTRWLVVALVASLAGVGACSSTSGPPTPEPLPLRIAVLAPLTGDASTSGRGALDAALTVVDAERSVLERAGLAVEVVPFDDRGQPSVGQQQASAIADDPRVVAVVGSVSSAVDIGVQPILSQAGLLSVSLGGSTSTLTARGPDDERPFAEYVTFAAQERDLGLVAAAVSEADGPNALLVTDGAAWSQARVAAFEKEWTKNAGSKATIYTLPRAPLEDDEAQDADQETDEEVLDRRLSELAASAQAQEPDVVFLALSPDVAWPVIEVLVAEADPPTVISGEELLEVPVAVRSTLAEQSGVMRVVSIGAEAGTIRGYVPERTGERQAAAGRFAMTASDAVSGVLDSMVALGAPDSEEGDVPTIGEVPYRAALSERFQASAVSGSAAAFDIDDNGRAQSRAVGVYGWTTQGWVARSGRWLTDP